MIMVLWLMDHSLKTKFFNYPIISYGCSIIQCKREKKRCLKPGSLAKIGLILTLDPDVKRLLFWIEDFEKHSRYSARSFLTIFWKKTIFLWQHLKTKNFKLSRLWPYLHWLHQLWQSIIFISLSEYYNFDFLLIMQNTTII